MKQRHACIIVKQVHGWKPLAAEKQTFAKKIVLYGKNNHTRCSNGVAMLSEKNPLISRLCFNLNRGYVIKYSVKFYCLDKMKLKNRNPPPQSFA